MLHDTFGAIAEKSNGQFRYRGKEPGRLENFSDACFALAITLLLISTSAPTNFEQIKKFTWEVIPFSMCLVFIILIWYEHFLFFYRYGLRTVRVIVLNTLFLVIVLFYVYPLKFLTKLFLIPVSYVFNIDWLFDETIGMIKGSDISSLMIIYGLGAASVSFVLMFMYRYALSQADALQLNALEIYDTKASIRTNFLMGIVPVVSVLLAVILFNSKWAGMYAGFTYFLYTPIMWVNGNKIEKGRRVILENVNTENT